MADLDRSIATAQRGYRQIAHDPSEGSLYAQFAAQWEQYRRVVQEVQSLYRSGAKSDAADLYNTKSKITYDAASDTLGLLTDRNVSSAREASARTQMAHRRARWLTGISIVLAGLAVAGAMTYVRLSISSPLLALTDRMHRLATNEMNIDIQGTARRDEIGDMARAVVVLAGAPHRASALVVLLDPVREQLGGLRISLVGKPPLLFGQWILNDKAAPITVAHHVRWQIVAFRGAHVHSASAPTGPQRGDLWPKPAVDRRCRNAIHASIELIQVDVAVTTQDSPVWNLLDA